MDMMGPRMRLFSSAGGIGAFVLVSTLRVVVCSVDLNAAVPATATAETRKFRRVNNASSPMRDISQSRDS